MREEKAIYSKVSNCFSEAKEFSPIPKINTKSLDISRSKRSFSFNLKDKLKNSFLNKFEELYFDAQRKNSIRSKKIAIDTIDKECTFKPKTNHNSKNLSKTHILIHNAFEPLAEYAKDFPLMKLIKKKRFYFNPR